MRRIVILGGGVGGTLTANLLVRKLRARIDLGEVEVVVVDATGQHVYQPGFMYIAMGGQKAAGLARPERSLLDKRVNLVVGEVERRRRRRGDGPPDRRPDADVHAARPRDRLADRAREHRALRHRGPSLLHRRCRGIAARGARRVQEGRIVIGIAGMPYKCPPAPLEVAFLIESELRERGIRTAPTSTSARRSVAPSRIESVSDMATPSSRPRASSSTRSSTSRRSTRSARRSLSLEGEELPLRPPDPGPAHKGQQFLIDSGLAPAPAAGCRPIGTPCWSVAGRTSTRWATPRTCRSRRPARPRTSRRRWSPSGSWPPSRAATPAGKHADYEGKVMCFFEIGDGKGTLLQFDFDHPPRPPKPNQLWHLARSSSTRRTGTPSRAAAYDEALILPAPVRRGLITRTTSSQSVHRRWRPRAAGRGSRDGRSR